MRDKSAYILLCPCGKTVESHERAMKCECGRELVVEGWGEVAEVVYGRKFNGT